MTSSEREELFSTLNELWDTLPEMRFGQLIVNVAYFAREPSAEAPWDVEDGELLEAARELLKQRLEAVNT
jgi:hypothetical protein